MSTAIKIENLSKQYRLGLVGTNTLHGDIKHWWAKMRGREKDLYKIGEENKLNDINGEYVWALRDINLEVQQGEVLGIIGKNGAGKSTLLKILSQVTGPTTGSIKVKGRIASLLEVGTGFHGELTGRENIFLNGAILGMKRHEIIRKFDEIVDFAGVAKYIDTPVKRYSSGMYVRLAFAVAAFLEPEILVVDEVLAVGDAEFQKKAIGKMQDVSTNEGRTVLFVSHNMASVKKLCNKGVLIENGSIVYRGDAHGTIEQYQSSNIKNKSPKREFDEKYSNEFVSINEISIQSDNNKPVNVESGFQIKLKITNHIVSNNLTVGINVYSLDDQHLFEAPCFLSLNNDSQAGQYVISGEIPPYLLNSGTYKIGLVVAENQKHVLFMDKNILAFEIEETLFNRGQSLKSASGLLVPNIKWDIGLIQS